MASVSPLFAKIIFLGIYRHSVASNFFDVYFLWHYGVIIKDFVNFAENYAHQGEVCDYLTTLKYK